MSQSKLSDVEIDAEKQSANRKRYEIYVHTAWKKHWRAEKWTIFLADIRNELTVWNNQVLLVKCLIDEALGITFSSEWMLPLIERTVSCRLISATSVLYVLCQYPCDEQKPGRCRKLIIDIVLPILDNIIIYAKEESESKRLSTCLLKCMNWLITCMNKCMGKPGEGCDMLVQSCYETIVMLLDSQFCKVLLYFCTDTVVRQAVEDSLRKAITLSQATKCRDIVKAICQKYLSIEKSFVAVTVLGGKLPVIYEPHCISLMIRKIVLVDYEFDVKQFCAWLDIINSFYSVTTQVLFKYLTHASFTAIADSASLSLEFTKFISFTYLILPEIFTHLLLKSENALSCKTDLVCGLKLLSSHAPTLKIVDKYLGVDSFLYFLQTLAGSGIITIEDVSNIGKFLQKENPPQLPTGKNLIPTILECKKELLLVMESCAQSNEGHYSKLEALLNKYSVNMILSILQLTCQLPSFVRILLQLSEKSCTIATEGVSVNVLNTAYSVLVCIRHVYGPRLIQQIGEQEKVKENNFYKWFIDDTKNLKSSTVAGGESFENRFLHNCLSSNMSLTVKSGKELLGILNCVNYEFIHKVISSLPQDLDQSNDANDSNDAGDDMSKIIESVTKLPVSVTMKLCLAIKSYVQSVEHKKRLGPLTMLQQLLDGASNVRNIAGDISLLREMTSNVITEIFYTFHPTSSLQVGPKLLAVSGDTFRMSLKELLEDIENCGIVQIKTIYFINDFILSEPDMSHLLPILLQTASTYGRHQEISSLMNFTVFLLTSSRDSTKLIKFGNAFLLKLLSHDKFQVNQLMFGPGNDLLVYLTGLLLAYTNWLLECDASQCKPKADGDILKRALNTFVQIKTGRGYDTADIEYLSRVLVMMSHNESCRFVLNLLDTETLVELLKIMLTDSTTADSISINTILRMFNLTHAKSKEACLNIICKYCTRSL